MQPVVAEEGWLRTGDLGEMDAEGNLYFRGRKKSVIVTPEGLNVYPEDIEAALRSQPEIRDCVVLGIRRDGNAVPAAVVIPNARSADISGAVQRANQSLADFQRVRTWMLWPDDDFPRTPTHKPRMAEIEAALNAEVGSVAQKRDPESLLGLIAKIQNGAARSQDELDLTSLDRVELASAIEDRYLVHLDDSQIANVRTVQGLEALLHTSNATQGPEAPRRYPYPQWQMSAPIRLLRGIVQSILVMPAVFLLARPRVVGREHLRAVSTPVLIISNHVTANDIGFLLYALPRTMRRNITVAMSGELLRDMRYPPRTLSPLQRWIEQLSYALVVALFHVQPLPQQADFRRSFDNLGRAVDRGFSVVVFPEGKRTTTGEMSLFRSGIGLLATRLQVPVVPMRIDGLFPFKAQERHYAPPGAITVHIGAARSVADNDAEQIARELEHAVRAL
jgi:long-chain acyl-CoA synthetase